MTAQAHDAPPRTPRGRATTPTRWTHAAIAGGATAAALAAVFVASARDVDRLGFLLWFRREGRGVADDGVVLLAVFSLAVVLAVAAFAGGGRLRPLETAANAAMKLALLAAVTFMLVNPDLPQFEQKSLTARAVAYPLVALAPAAAFALRGMRTPYPSLPDLLLTFTLALDIVGNDLHWYGNWRHWDDAAHLANAVPFVVLLVALLLALERRGALRLGFWGAAIFALAIFTSLHGLWEIEEHLMDRYVGTELQPGGMAEATRNNLSSMAGSLVAVALLCWWRAGGLLATLVAQVEAYVTALRA